MKYKVWTDKLDGNSDNNTRDPDFEDNIYLDDVNIFSTDLIGDKWPKDVTIKIYDKIENCDTFQCGPYLIVNDKVKDILETYSVMYPIRFYP